MPTQARVKLLTDYAYSPTDPGSEDDIRHDIDGSIQEVYDIMDSAKETAGAAATVQANLNTHKTSSDHDGRYYTEAEVDAIAAGIVQGGIAPNSVTNPYLGTDVKVGSLAALTTSDKTSVTAAVNEVDSNADAAQTTANNAQSTANAAIAKSIVDAAGDLIYATANDTVTRLPIGTAFQVLSVNTGATAPEWKTLVTDDGAWQKIAEQTLAADVTQIDFSSISSGYKKFEIHYNLVTPSATNENMQIVFNDDTTVANYETHECYNQNSSFNGALRTAFANIQLIYARSSDGTSGRSSSGRIEITNISNKFKSVIADYSSSNNVPALIRGFMNGFWKNSSNEISKISLTNSSSQFITGSKFVLWGFK